MATHVEIMALHRYFIWADRMRVHFYEMLPDSVTTAFDQTSEAMFTHPYMSYWYGGMFVVIEGWRKLELRDAELDEMLASPNSDLLRRYRNGSFHFQGNYFDPRFFEFMGGERTPEWIFRLRQAFSRWFLDYFASREGRTTP